MSKALNTKDLRGKDIAELKADLKKLKVELTKKKESLMLGKDKKLSDVMVLRKDIARISTVLREKEILKELEK
jgi:ribosomal protein L29